MRDENHVVLTFVALKAPAEALEERLGNRRDDSSDAAASVKGAQTGYGKPPRSGSPG